MLWYLHGGTLIGTHCDTWTMPLIRILQKIQRYAIALHRDIRTAKYCDALQPEMHSTDQLKSDIHLTHFHCDTHTHCR